MRVAKEKRKDWKKCNRRLPRVRFRIPYSPNRGNSVLVPAVFQRILIRTAAESLNIMPKIRQKKPAIAVTDVLAAEAAGMMMSAIAAEVMTAARKPEKNTKDVVAESIKERRREIR